MCGLLLRLLGVIDLSLVGSVEEVNDFLGDVKAFASVHYAFKSCGGEDQVVLLVLVEGFELSYHLIVKGFLSICLSFHRLLSVALLQLSAFLLHGGDALLFGIDLSLSGKETFLSLLHIAGVGLLSFLRLVGKCLLIALDLSLDLLVCLSVVLVVLVERVERYNAYLELVRRNGDRSCQAV